MDEKAAAVLKEKLTGRTVSAMLPPLIDLTLEFGREMPDDIAAVLDATGMNWRYYNTMISYAIRWYRLGFSPAKLKKLMSEAIQEMSGPEGNSGKRTAMKMFMDYLQYKKDIDAYLKQKNGVS